jgi:hypothetical protein
MPEIPPLVEQAYLLISRLERISVDSIWARRSSGHRGALLRWVEDNSRSRNGAALKEQEQARLERLVAAGFDLLERAARERFR